MNSKAYKIFSVLGIVAPLLLFCGISVLGVFAPNYNPLTQYVSVLGSDNSPFRVMFNFIAFGLFGIIMMGFALALERQLKPSYLSQTATRLFLGSGVLIFILSFFPTDLGYPSTTFDGKMHSLFGTVAFVMVPISIIWFGLAFRQDENWEKFWSMMSFLLAGIALLTALLLQIFPQFVLNGSVERIGIGAVWLWMFFVSLNLLLLDKLRTIQISPEV